MTSTGYNHPDRAWLMRRRSEIVNALGAIKDDPTGTGRSVVAQCMQVVADQLQKLADEIAPERPLITHPIADFGILDEVDPLGYANEPGPAESPRKLVTAPLEAFTVDLGIHWEASCDECGPDWFYASHARSDLAELSIAARQHAVEHDHVTRVVQVGPGTRYSLDPDARSEKPFPAQGPVAVQRPGHGAS